MSSRTCGCSTEDASRLSKPLLVAHWLYSSHMLINHGSGPRERIFKVPLSQRYEGSLVSFQAAWGNRERESFIDAVQLAPARTSSARGDVFGINSESLAASTYSRLGGRQRLEWLGAWQRVLRTPVQFCKCGRWVLRLKNEHTARIATILDIQLRFWLTIMMQAH
jgi:hypothetical protein